MLTLSHSAPTTLFELPPGFRYAVQKKRQPSLEWLTDPALQRREQRLAEYLQGRKLAAELLTELGSLNTEVGRHASSSAPVWPVGFVGSISHSQQWLGVVVGPQACTRSIGIDIEACADEAMAQHIDAVCLNAQEAALAESLDLRPEDSRVLFFSAKESLYKCLHPVVERYFDFLDAEVMRCDLLAGTLELRLLNTLSSRFTRGVTVEAGFRLTKGHVYTAVVLRD
jgi:enterobactin synthetase component D